MIKTLLGVFIFILVFPLRNDAQNPWTQKANFGGGIRAVPVGFSIGHYGFVGCGTNGSNQSDFWKYDIYTNTWTQIANYPGNGQYACTGFTIEGKGYVCFGANSSRVGTSDLWEYDTITGVWSAKASCPGIGRYDVNGFVIGHKAYFIGGGYTGPPYLNEAWVYDSHANLWTQLHNFPSGKLEGILAFSIGNYGYAGYGYYNTNCNDTMYKYDTTSDTWSRIAGIPTSYDWAGNPRDCVIGTNAYCFNGDKCNVPGPTEGWVYDTVTSSWCIFVSMSHQRLTRGYCAALVINNHIYIGLGYDTAINYLGDWWEYTPSTKINVSDTVLCTSDTVHFSDSSSYFVNGWSWSFPGGSPATSTLPNPSVAYTSSGTYNVKLIVTACGGGDTVSQNITVVTGGLGSIGVQGHSGICSGAADTLIATGGTTYLWSSGVTASSIIIHPDSTGTYSVYVSGGCANKDTSITVTVNPPPSVSLAGNSVLCAGDSTRLSASGGTNYFWSTGATTSSILINPASNTTYFIQISNGGCIKDTSLQVTVNPLPNTIITGNNAVCLGDSSLLTASGGGAYLWNTGQTSGAITVTPSVTSVYTVTVTNSFGCKADTTYQVNVALPDGAISGPSFLCLGDNISLTATGGGTYEWSTGATDNSITISPTANTTYNVIVNNGCIDTVSKTVFVDAPALYACCDTIVPIPGTTVILLASGTLNYFWTPSAGLSCDSCPDPSVNPTVTTTYTVLGTDSAGCRRSQTITVEVSNCLSAPIPNVFTPNGDKINDEFVIMAQYTSDYSISIYDRWGVVMYQSNNPYLYWDGTNQENFNPVPTGIYYYIIKYTCNNQSNNKNGFVEVIR